MNLSLGRVKRLLPNSEYLLVEEVVRARELPADEIMRIRPLVRGWRDKYVDRAHQQAREARRKGQPRSTRGSESNENTMRQVDVMDWVLDRLNELEAQAADSQAKAEAQPGAARTAPDTPSRAAVREAISQPHVSTFGDLWAEFPDTPVSQLRKILWSLVEADEVGLTTGGGIELTAEAEVAFVEEVQEIEGVPVKQRSRDRGLPKDHQQHLARTNVVRIRSHKRSQGSRSQAKRDHRGGGRR